ncbi:MAG: hypothetical protein ACE366_00155 [Bradymonadia bacterium]
MKATRPHLPRWSTLSWCVWACLWGCAGERSKTFQPLVEPPGLDAGPPDAQIEQPDLSVVEDAGFDASPPPPPMPISRTHWFVIYADRWSEGFRGQLEPAHRPLRPDTGAEGAPRVAALSETLAALGEPPVLLHWQGPNHPSDTLLTALLEAGVTVGVDYPLDARITDQPQPADVIRSDVAWLAARAFERPTSLMVSGHPVIRVRPPEDAALWSVFLSALDDVNVSAFLVVEIDLSSPPALPPGASALVPTNGPGYAGDEAFGRRMEDLEGWRRFATESEVSWLALAHPPINPRLADPGGAFDGHEGGLAWRRAIALARQEVSAEAPLMIVESLGGWADDRQLEGVRGADTAHPEMLTDGLAYRAYDTQRLDAVAALLLAPATDTPAPPPGEAISILRQSRGLSLNMLERDAGRVSLGVRHPPGGAQRLEALVDARPFIVPPGLQLQYRRSDAALSLGVLFENGSRSMEGVVRLMDAEGEIMALDLSAEAGRRVEGLLLRYTGDGEGLTGAVDAIRYVTP